MKNTATDSRFLEIFEQLAEYYGPLGWWPAETPFEVCVGAILTQNTAWTNVEKAIAALKDAEVLTAGKLREIEIERLAPLIRSAGFFNIKSRRLKNFVDWLFARHGGSLERMFSNDWRLLREDLLSVAGIGPETCDAILLYAGGKPTFVVDAYTRRLFQRLGMLPQGAGYDATRRLFMKNLLPEATLFNEYHALIVEHSKRFCRKSPRCSGCPLTEQCCCRIS
jgi:endonuclease-3 related protein